MKPFEDPELPHIDGSEIQAVVDVTLHGVDNIPRPFYLNQDQNLIHLTLEDAIRLHKFLEEAIVFVKDYNERTVQ